jgi:hypothetical protein
MQAEPRYNISGSPRPQRQYAVHPSAYLRHAISVTTYPEKIVAVVFVVMPNASCNRRTHKQADKNGSEKKRTRKVVQVVDAYG